MQRTQVLLSGGGSYVTTLTEEEVLEKVQAAMKRGRGTAVQLDGVPGYIIAEHVAAVRDLD